MVNVKENGVIRAVIILLVVIVLGLGIYIGISVYQDRNSDNDKVLINEDEEISILDDKLSEISSPLGMMIFSTAIDNGKDGDYYRVSSGVNLLDDIKNRQLFVMEYILTYKNNYDKFIVLGEPSLEVVEEGTPTDDMTMAYLKYDDFNVYYKELFDEDFDVSKAQKGNTSYDDDYVYYFNRRSGLNGVYVPEMTGNSVKYEDGRYVASIKIVYSTRAVNFLGKTEDKGELEYIKNSDGEVILKSLIIES